MSSFLPTGYVELSDAVAMLTDGAVDSAPAGGQGLADAMIRSQAWAAVHSEAWRVTRSALFAGSLQAYALSSTSGWEPVPSNTWASDQAEAPPRTIVINRSPLVERCKVMVRLDDLLTFLRGQPSQISPPSSVAMEGEQLTADDPATCVEEKPKGGRPATHDAVEFVSIAAGLVFEGKQFKTAAAFRKAALEAYCAEMEPTAPMPSDDWAKPHVRKLWKRLKPAG